MTNECNREYLELRYRQDKDLLGNKIKLPDGNYEAVRIIRKCPFQCDYNGVVVMVVKNGTISSLSIQPEVEESKCKKLQVPYKSN